MPRKRPTPQQIAADMIEERNLEGDEAPAGETNGQRRAWPFPSKTNGEVPPITRRPGTDSPKTKP